MKKSGHVPKIGDCESGACWGVWAVRGRCRGATRGAGAKEEIIAGTHVLPRTSGVTRHVVVVSVSSAMFSVTCCRTARAATSHMSLSSFSRFRERIGDGWRFWRF